MNQAISAKKRKPEPVYLRVIQGGLVPADNYAQEQLRNKKFKIGDVVKCDLRKLRSNGFNRLVHRLGSLCVKHIEEFSGLDSHKAIKKIQLEGNIYCDEVALNLNGFDLSVWRYVRPVVEPVLNMVGFRIDDSGVLIARYPISLSYETMDQSEFEDLARKVSRHIAERYWNGLTPEEIEEMSTSMIDE